MGSACARSWACCGYTAHVLVLPASRSGPSFLASTIWRNPGLPNHVSPWIWCAVLHASEPTVCWLCRPFASRRSMLRLPLHHPFPACHQAIALYHLHAARVFRRGRVTGVMKNDGQGHRDGEHPVSEADHTDHAPALNLTVTRSCRTDSAETIAPMTGEL